MDDLGPPFRPLRRRDGYLPLEDLGLIGDGATAALVGLDGSVPWLCLPRFDSEPVFCGLLDHTRGGHFTVAPQDVTEARQRYEPDTGVLVTELRCATGLVRLTDAMAVRSGADLGEFDGVCGELLVMRRSPDRVVDRSPAGPPGPERPGTRQRCPTV